MYYNYKKKKKFHYSQDFKRVPTILVSHLLTDKSSEVQKVIESGHHENDKVIAENDKTQEHLTPNQPGHGDIGTDTQHHEDDQHWFHVEKSNDFHYIIDPSYVLPSPGLSQELTKYPNPLATKDDVLLSGHNVILMFLLYTTGSNPNNTKFIDFSQLSTKISGFVYQHWVKCMNGIGITPFSYKHYSSGVPQSPPYDVEWINLADLYYSVLNTPVRRNFHQGTSFTRKDYRKDKYGVDIYDDTILEESMRPDPQSPLNISNPTIFKIYWDSFLKQGGSYIPIKLSGWDVTYMDVCNNYFDLKGFIKNSTLNSQYSTSANGNLTENVMFSIYYDKVNQKVVSDWDSSKPLVVPQQMGLPFINQINSKDGQKDIWDYQVNNNNLFLPTDIVLIGRTTNSQKATELGIPVNYTFLCATIYHLERKNHSYGQHYLYTWHYDELDTYIFEKPDNTQPGGSDYNYPSQHYIANKY
jgi:hypothetical protein